MAGVHCCDGGVVGAIWVRIDGDCGISATLPCGGRNGVKGRTRADLAGDFVGSYCIAEMLAVAELDGLDGVVDGGVAGRAHVCRYGTYALCRSILEEADNDCQTIYVIDCHGSDE